MEIMWGTENMYAHSPVNLFPYDPTSAVGPLYGKWFATGGASGKTPPGRLKELLELYREGFSAPEKQHYEIGEEDLADRDRGAVRDRNRGVGAGDHGAAGRQDEHGECAVEDVQWVVDAASEAVEAGDGVL